MLCPKNLDNLQKQPILVNFKYKNLNVAYVFCAKWIYLQFVTLKSFMDF